MTSEPTSPLDLDGYVDDGLYPSNLHPQFQPPWTQAILEFHGFAPPTTERLPFRFVDLGCGDGFGLILMAAAHPEGEFLGVDATPAHVDRGNAHIAELGITNVRLQCTTFDALATAAVGDADYVMAQGVLSWVSPAVRAALWRAAAKLLRPGGVFSVGYNAQPGWGWVIPLQRLLRAHAETLVGPREDRFDRAFEFVRANGLVEPKLIEWMEGRRAKLPREYFAHEYLNAYWEPQWCSEVWREASAVGLDFLAEASALCLREDFALKAAWRDQLRGMASRTERALVTDMRVHRWYRVDIFGRALHPRLTAAQVCEHRLATHWGTEVATDEASFELTTPAGTLRFANVAARGILDALQAGPRSLTTVPGLASVDLLETIDALWMADLVLPLSPFAPLAHGAATNRAVFAAAREREPMNGVVGHHGAITVTRDAVASGLSASLRRRLAIA